MNDSITIRPLAREHVPDVQRFVADPLLAATTRIPHPYPEGAALRYFEEHVLPGWITGTDYSFAILAGEQLVGSMSLKDVDRARGQAELGYWIGRPYWGRGYATAAARQVLRFAFEELGLTRLYAHVLERNPASARVLEKLGFQRVELAPEEVPDVCAARGPTWGFELRRVVPEP